MKNLVNYLLAQLPFLAGSLLAEAKYFIVNQIGTKTRYLTPYDLLKDLSGKYLLIYKGEKGEKEEIDSCTRLFESLLKQNTNIHDAEGISLFSLIPESLGISWKRNSSRSYEVKEIFQDKPICFLEKKENTFSPTVIYATCDCTHEESTISRSKEFWLVVPLNV